jgi:hypothetical protein
MLPAYAGHAKFMLKHISAKVGKEGNIREPLIKSVTPAQAGVQLIEVG